jgi:hypothetical protein
MFFWKRQSKKKYIQKAHSFLEPLYLSAVKHEERYNLKAASDTRLVFAPILSSTFYEWLMLEQCFESKIPASECAKKLINLRLLCYRLEKLEVLVASELFGQPVRLAPVDWHYEAMALQHENVESFEMPLETRDENSVTADV